MEKDNKNHDEKQGSNKSLIPSRYIHVFKDQKFHFLLIKKLIYQLLSLF